MCSVEVITAHGSDQPDTPDDWLEPWTEDQLKGWQRADTVIGRVITWLETSPQKPPWQEVATGSVTLKYYWTIWDSLSLVNGILVRTYHPHPGSPKVVRQMIAPPEIRNSLAVTSWESDG